MNAPDPNVVGTYLTEKEARSAASRLTEVGIGPTEVVHLAEDAWQVKAPGAKREEALQVLQLMEQHNIADSQ